MSLIVLMRKISEYTNNYYVHTQNRNYIYSIVVNHSSIFRFRYNW
jgi:hypothetical protein